MAVASPDCARAASVGTGFVHTGEIPLITQGNHNDTIFEFQMDGTLLGQVVAPDQISGNGIGMAYDPSIGRIFTSSQYPGLITLFDDPGREIPEPTGLLLLATGWAILLMQRRRDRRP